MRHVDAIGFSPRGDDVAVPNDDSRWFPTRLERPDALTVRLSSERLVVRDLHVARRFRVGLDRELDGSRRRAGSNPAAAGSFRSQVAPGTYDVAVRGACRGCEAAGVAVTSNARKTDSGRARSIGALGRGRAKSYGPGFGVQHGHA